MTDEETLHPLGGDLDHCGDKVPTLAEMAIAFDGVTTAFAPLLQAMRQFDEQIGALGRAYCQVIESCTQQIAEENWSWSADAARWRPETVD